GGRSVWNGDQANSIAVRPDSELFIEVQADSNASFDVGGYTLVVRFDEVNVIDQDTEDEVVFSNLRRLMVDDFDDFFDQDEETYFHEDGHSDDDLESALELAELAGYGRMQKYEFVGSLTGNKDRDYFKIKSPTDLANDVATISVRSLDAGKLIPLVQLFDDQHQAVASRILVNGNGDYIVQAAGIQPDREYFVEIQAADATDGFATGNYQLTALFGGRTVPVAEFSAGSLFDSAESTSLHVATTQLFHFGLSVDDTTAASREGALIRIVNSEGKVLTQVAAATGQTRTAGNVLLSPGQYRIQTIPLRSEVNQNPTALKYLVRGSVVSDPFGVDPLEPSSTEYQCPDLNGVFCYPGGIQSPDPYIFDDFLNQFPDAGVIDVSNWDQFILGEWWNWYWQETGLNNSEPLGFSDTYDAQQGLPLEVSSFQGVLQNDIDPNADSLSAVLVNAPSAGQLSLQASGAFQYVSTNRFEGTDSFTYRVSDGESLSAEVTVTIHVGANPAALGDFDQDGQFGQSDIQRMRQAIEAGWIGAFDLNHDSVTDAHDWQILIHDVIGTSFGDANLDGRFDSQDLIAVFQSGRFEVSNTLSPPVEWNAGDWNGDGSFDTADLVLAFQDGAYDVNGATTAQESNSVLGDIAAAMTSRRQQEKHASVFRD
ncbi:MAG: cadherin-like domain-containing protein, partial [Planctomycetales bacterium]|nr:cadherin-like domain-containing protein [Planctomycetales bacterium]